MAYFLQTLTPLLSEQLSLPVMASEGYLRQEMIGTSNFFPRSDHLRISRSLATRAVSSLKNLATVFSTSSGETGSMSSWDFFVSARNSGSFMVSINAFCKTLTRSFGVPGGNEYGRVMEFGS